MVNTKNNYKNIIRTEGMTNSIMMDILDDIDNRIENTQNARLKAYVQRLEDRIEELEKSFFLEGEGEETEDHENDSVSDESDSETDRS